MAVGQVSADEPCVSLVPLFAGLTGEQQAEVATLAHPVTVGSGETFVRAGARRAPLFVVHSGLVKLSRTTADGRDTTLQVIGPGEVGGETWLLTGERPESDVVALEASRMCVFEPAVLDTLVRQFPSVGVALLRALAMRLHSAERMLAARTLAEVGARLAAYLLDCPTTWGEAASRPRTCRWPRRTSRPSSEPRPRPSAGGSRRWSARASIQVHGTDVDVLDPIGLELRARGA